MRRLLTVLIIAVIVGVGYLAVTQHWLRNGIGGALGGTSGTVQTGSGTNDTQPDVVSEPGIPPSATEAVVEYVHDGDTLFLADGRKVRLLGINTPEIGENLECYGDEATALLRALLPEGTHVWVVSDIEPLDQYGRSLLFIHTDAGANVNLELLSAGAATVEIYRPNLLLQNEVNAAEDAARDAKAGLWGACR